MKLHHLTLLVILCVPAIFAQKEESVYQSNGIAIGGYDPVAYFKQGKAVKGKEEFQTVYKSAKWYFATADDRDAFVKNPTAFEPQFDGYCAYGVCAKKAKYPVNPETFKIKDGKLYLFYNDQSLNTLILWDKDENELIKKTDDNWKSLNK